MRNGLDVPGQRWDWQRHWYTFELGSVRVIFLSSEHANDGNVEPVWRALFEDFPDRFMVGTDTYTPERWYYVVEHAAWSRTWLAGLPSELADNIAWRNAERLADWALKR